MPRLTAKKSATNKVAEPPSRHLTDAEFHAGMSEFWDDMERLPLKKQRNILIEIGALTPEGNVPVYPMDHVPLGPRE